MADRNDKWNDPNLFKDSMQAGDNYLGDRDTVESLLRVAIARYVDVILSDDSQMTKETKLSARTRQVARILLGQDENYKPIPGWNTPGKIDRFSEKWLGLSGNTPEEVMIHAIVKLFAEIRRVADFAGEDETLDGQWEPAADEILDRYVGVFMGIDLPTQAILK